MIAVAFIGCYGVNLNIVFTLFICSVVVFLRGNKLRLYLVHEREWIDFQLPGAFNYMVRHSRNAGITQESASLKHISRCCFKHPQCFY
ncbi:unnamed protein product [Cylicocyclus nassatus]|uniref:Uncharacterized protein n=1 Tax=Cylicocyclus nassatus TaxID=53992 RepID=A0AA36H4L1_CYLNA|nr:unnamed protein product [Cylicocyclus nassatus]